MFDSISFFSFDSRNWDSMELGFLVQVITGVTDAELHNFDVIEGTEYERVTVEVVRTVSLRIRSLVSDQMQFFR